MQAPKFDRQMLPPPPGIIGSLRAGFDAITAHMSLILMPLGLDLLLWLGPRLSMNEIAQPVLKEASAMATGSGLQPDDIRTALDLYKQFFTQFNLLVVLRTFPVGISSLMSGRLPTQSPLGAPSVVQVDSAGHLIGLLFLLTLVGWTLGAVYFRSVAALVIPEGILETTPATGRAVMQTLMYSLVCAVLAWTLGLPMVFVVYLLFAINTWLGQGVLLFFGFISLWLIVPFFFSPHGIFVRKQNAIASFLGSFQMTRFTLPTSSLFVLTALLLGMGLNVLWSTPTEDSWLALVGILGHAFITTALLASSFIYYQQMTTWLETVLARLRAGMPTQQA
jgi:hypothetical protein